MQIKRPGNHRLMIILLLAGIATIFSCSEEFWPELNSEYEHLLVVDGKITNDPGPYTIRLSTTSSIQENKYNPLSGAVVSISDNQGNSEVLQEAEQGTYRTSVGGIQGIVGSQYKITIEVNGNQYESSFEELRNPVGVQSLYAEWIKHPGATAEEDQYGYQFYLSTDIAQNPVNYFYWEIAETYQYQSYFYAHSIYWGNNRFEPIIKSDTLFNCWKTNLIDERFTYTTKNLATPEIVKLPINFVANTNKFTVKYAIQAKQYTISENAYVFLNSLQKQNNIANSLYTTQPYQILGNIHNVDNSEEPVLGYFLTAGVSLSSPIMVRTPAGFYLPSDIEECPGFKAENMQRTMQNLLSMPSSKWPIVLAQDPFSGDPAIFIIVDPECVDCRARGGNIIKPDYWNDNSLFVDTDQ